MECFKNILGRICILLALFSSSQQNVHLGVDLVTKLTNDLIQMVFKDASAGSENVLISPFGLMSNMAMILEGSSDKTQQELLQAMNITSTDLANLRKGFKAYCDLFLKYSNEPEAAGSFTSASLSASFNLNTTYKDVLEKFYCANVSQNSSSNATSSTLELSSVTGVMTHWKDYEKLSVYTFLSHQPMKTFVKRNGEVVLVPMIPQVGVFRSGYWENAQIILIPLQARLVELLVIIPEKIQSVDGLLKKLSEYSIPLLVQSLPKQEAEVFLPQMAIVKKNLNLQSLLIRNGIQRVFDEQKSDLSKISSKNNTRIHLTKLEQNAFFSTSFVALNSVSGISGPLEESKRSKRDARKYYADKPFLFFVLQKDTQMVLLAGKAENPDQVPK